MTVPNYGHQDVFRGQNNNVDIFPRLLEFLEERRKPRSVAGRREPQRPSRGDMWRRTNGEAEDSSTDVGEVRDGRRYLAQFAGRGRWVCRETGFRSILLQGAAFSGSPAHLCTPENQILGDVFGTDNDERAAGWRQTKGGEALEDRPSRNTRTSEVSPRAGKPGGRRLAVRVVRRSRGGKGSLYGHRSDVSPDGPRSSTRTS